MRTLDLGKGQGVRFVVGNVNPGKHFSYKRQRGGEVKEVGHMLNSFIFYYLLYI